MSSVSLINGHIDDDDDDVTEMTDKDIIKALECHYSLNLQKCKMKCPLRDKPLCSEWLSKYALDLINRQKAEIERQNDIIHRQSDVISEQKEKIDRIYAEAVIECADLSIKRICENVTPTPGRVKKMTMTEYPRGEQNVLKLRKQINELIRENLK